MSSSSDTQKPAATTLTKRTLSPFKAPGAKKTDQSTQPPPPSTPPASEPKYPVKPGNQLTPLIFPTMPAAKASSSPRPPLTAEDSKFIETLLDKYNSTFANQRTDPVLDMLLDESSDIGINKL